MTAVDQVKPENAAEPPPVGHAVAGPVAPPDRIGSLDLLRGGALLGILVINIQSFGMIAAAYMNPTATGNLAGTEFAVWLIAHLFFDQKCMAIFSMLYGAGIVLLSERLESRGLPTAGIHIRRNLLLVLFGILHAYLLWFGDILFAYGLLGLCLFWVRRLPPGLLLFLGGLMLCVPIGFNLFSGLSLPYWPAEARTEFALEMAPDWNPSPAMIAEEIAVYRGSWLDQMPSRATTALEFQTFIMLIWTGWRAGGLMLVGMALYRFGILSGRRSTRFYRNGLVAGLAVGIPGVLSGVHQNFAHNWEIEFSLFLGSLWNYVFSLPIAFAWICLAVLVFNSGICGQLQAALAAVGRTALSNYIMQSIICTLLFYGHGFGLFGSVNRVGLLGIVLSVWVCQLILSVLWLRRFRCGPLEWVLRSLTYTRLVSLR